MPILRNSTGPIPGTTGGPATNPYEKYGLPYSLNPPTAKKQTRMSLQDLFNGADIGDQGAYDEALASGEAGRAREENRGVENVLGNLQGRGLATSGIALRDIADQVIGPSAERARSLASTFGLERARNRTGLMNDLTKGEQGYGNQYSLQELQGDQRMAQLEREAQIQDQRATAERRRRRQAGLAGLFGGVAGGAAGAYLGGPAGATAGSNIGSTFAGGYDYA